MIEHPRHRPSILAPALFALVLAFLIATPVKARAATMAELQAEVVRCSDEYDAAAARVEELQAEIEANEARIEEIEALLPDQRQRACDSIRWQYRVSRDAPGLIEMVLSAEDFYDMLATIQYLDIIQTRNNNELQALIDLDAELTQTRQDLADDMARAEEERAAAQEALDAAVAAREELQAAILAQEAAERAEREHAIEEAKKQATFTNASGQETAVEIPPSADTGATGGGVSGGGSSSGDGSEGDSGAAGPAVTTREYYVEVWSARIDNYLAGSPLAGYGYAFAEAAWDYGVDPRWSPAIAAVESSKGYYCFEPYNAWGWFASLGNDWDSSIRAHVRGLANGYGYTLTYAGARSYCPPGDAWYAACAAEMLYVWPNDQL